MKAAALTRAEQLKIFITTTSLNFRPIILKIVSFTLSWCFGHTFQALKKTIFKKFVSSPSLPALIRNSKALQESTCTTYMYDCLFDRKFVTPVLYIKSLSTFSMSTRKSMCLHNSSRFPLLSCTFQSICVQLFTWSPPTWNNDTTCLLWPVGFISIYLYLSIYLSFYICIYIHGDGGMYLFVPELFSKSLAEPAAHTRTKQSPAT